ncbi:sodium-dependent transporter [Ruminococcus sp. 210702-SL.1.03]|uniref:sodium-dependent transporter n=1 Tax=Ruminococcus sp. 210702-SL.1.03 TaxID=2883233 RepID=UPI001D05D7E0|nr:sodium-dependent transporter [Ruminococcus sp. 210702-SL.1.03]MCB6615169.1 sodium-dependent transporter [Ruminococcus sp. 210702-SL.1.03]
MEKSNERATFQSRLGFILVSAGCAIGLGNVWKFPYICGQNGGGAFLLLYLLCLALLGMPILLCEFAVGRGSRKSLSRAYDILEKPGSRFHLTKYAGVAGNYLLMMFYTMVTGWMLYYAFRYLTGGIQAADTQQTAAAFDSMLASPQQMFIFSAVVIALCIGVCALGLQNGIEKVTKVMMILLMVLMVVMAVNSLTLKGAMKGLKFYLVPDFSKFSEIGFPTVLFSAMTQAFFTLSIGIGSLEIFGSYLKKDRTLIGESLNVIILDTAVAVVAGLIIIPACFAYGIQPDSGPSLLFITLPNVFYHMPYGRAWGTLFFIFMSFAALSTVIAVFENIITMISELSGISRRSSLLLNLVLITVLSLPAILGYSTLSGIQPLGDGSTIMDLEDFLVSSNLLPLGSLTIALFCVKKNGWGWENFSAEVNTGEGKRLPDCLRGYMTYIVPAVICFIYLKGYYDTFAGSGTLTLFFWMTFAVVLLALVFAAAFTRRGSAAESARRAVEEQ